MVFINNEIINCDKLLLPTFPHADKGLQLLARQNSNNSEFHCQLSCLFSSPHYQETALALFLSPAFAHIAGCYKTHQNRGQPLREDNSHKIAQRESHSIHGRVHPVCFKPGGASAARIGDWQANGTAFRTAPKIGIPYLWGGHSYSWVDRHSNFLWNLVPLSYTLPRKDFSKLVSCEHDLSRRSSTIGKVPKSPA